MANPTTNLSIVLPVPGAESSRGTWGTTVNDALQSLDTGVATRGVPSGGTDDQILTKNGTVDYSTEWATRLSSVAVTGSDGIEVDSGSPITTNGTIALGINKTTLLSFLNAEDGATSDQTNAEIKTAYEANADTNEFSDAEQTKLSGIETSATADQSASQIKTAYESNANSNEFSDAEQTKLSGIEASATADQTAAQIKTLYEAETSAFTDAQFTKLAGIETAATADQTGSQIKTLYQAETNAFTDAQFTKLAGIATSATADQTVTATGDVTGSGTTSLALTLASSGVSAATYGSATLVPVLVVDVKGRITSASTATISAQTAAQVTAEATAQSISMSIALG